VRSAKEPGGKYARAPGAVCCTYLASLGVRAALSKGTAGQGRMTFLISSNAVVWLREQQRHKKKQAISLW